MEELNIIEELDKAAKQNLEFSPQYIPQTLFFMAAREIERLQNANAKLRDVLNEVLDSEFELSERGVVRLISLCETVLDETK